MNRNDTIREALQAAKGQMANDFTACTGYTIGFAGEATAYAKVDKALALLDTPEPTDDMEEVVEHIIDIIDSESHEESIIRRCSAYLAARDRRRDEELVEEVKREATWSIAQDGTECMWLTPAALDALLEGGPL